MIGTDFYTYEDNIIKCLEEFDYSVDKITDEPRRIHGYGFVPEKYKKKDQFYFQKKLLTRLNKTYDVILVIVGRKIQNFFLEELKKRNPNAQFILYLWDEIARVENFENVKDFYDEIITFDLDDSLRRGFRFVPLYYIPEYHLTNTLKKYDVCTVSYDHSDRMKIIRKFIEDNPQKIKYNFRLLGSWRLYLKYILAGRKKTDVEHGLLYTTKDASISEIAGYMSESRAILDIQHYTQKGLTMRSIEALGSGVKLITTNDEIKYYDFYNPNNICIINREDPHIDINFLRSNYERVPHDIYEKYSLKSWLEAILYKKNYYYLNCDWEEVKNLIFDK